MSHVTDMLSLLLLLGVGLAWLQLSRARELAATEASRLCQRHGLQLLDETVGLRSLRLRRGPRGLALVRGYAFDVSIDGADREASRLWMAGSQVTGYELPNISARRPEAVPANSRPSAQIIDLSERIRQTRQGRPH